MPTASTLVDTSFLAAARANRRNHNQSKHQLHQHHSHKPLTQLWKQVKTELRTDGTRLRSGEYPFPRKVTSRFDVYDPRNLAASYLDVTLLGDSWTIAGGGGRASKTPPNQTILGYIHVHHRFRDRLSLDFSVTANPSLASICFSQDTLQEHNLLNASPQGRQLRIYNAVVLPSQPERFLVLCTQLCEPYPTDILGQLQPELTQLLQQQLQQQPARAGGSTN